MARILIIEDQPLMRQNLATILQMESHSVITAADGREGLAKLEKEKPDLVICDVMMPHLSGHEVLATLRQRPGYAAVPFIFLTARGSRQDVRQGMDLGADDYLSKPFQRGELLAAVNTRLRKHDAVVDELKAGLAPARTEPSFDSAAPLQTLGLTQREAEVLLWVAQGKSNHDVGILLNMAEKTVKKHLTSIFSKLGVESRTAASLRALETLLKTS